LRDRELFASYFSLGIISSHHLPEFEINYLMDLFKIGDICRHNYRPYLPVWETGL
jgi:hypothetical protein